MAKTSDTIRVGLRISTIEGTFATIHIVLTSGAFLTGYALMLGANAFQIGILAAIPFIAQIFQILSAILVEKVRKRKNISLLAVVLSREVWIFLIFLPFVSFIPKQGKIVAFLIVIAFSSVFGVIAANAWLSWMSDMVPERIRGRYFGVRNSILAFTTMVTTVIGSIILDHFRATNREEDGFATLITIAAIAAGIAGFLLAKQPEPPMTGKLSKSILTAILSPLQDRYFRKILAFFFVWNAAVGFAAPFFSVHMIKNLNMSYTLISFYSIVPTGISILANRYWGKLLDRFGTKSTLLLNAFAIAFIPLIWLFPRKDFLLPLWFEAPFSGLTWAGFNLAAFNVPMTASPRIGRPYFLALFAIVTGIGFFIASILGGYIAQFLSNWHWHLDGITLINLHLIFALSAIGRLMSAFILLKVREPREKGMMVMVQFMGYNLLKRLSLRSELFMAFRRKAK